MNRSTLYLVAIAAIGGAALVVSTSVAAPPTDADAGAPGKSGVYHPKGHSFEVALAKGTAAGKLKRNGARLQLEEKLSVKLDASKASAHSVTSKADHEDIAAGGRLKLTVSDADASSTTDYGYDPATSTITLTTGPDSVAIVRNPDGTYLVDGAPAATGKAAATLVRTKKAYTSASPYGMLVAYASAQTPVPEVKMSSCSSTTSSQAASAPAVCSLFDELCECLACDASGKWNACSKCP